MPRTAPSVATRPSSDRAAVELPDRTGIVAASLPRRRRTDDELPELTEPIYTRPPVCDQDLRPKSVVIRRRARTWLGGGAAVLLVAVGWVAAWTAERRALRAGDRRTTSPRSTRGPPSRPPRRRCPSPSRCPSRSPRSSSRRRRPSTCRCPRRSRLSKQVQVQAKAQPKKPSADDTDVPRVDLPSATTPPPSTNAVQEWVDAAESVMQQYQYRSGR